MTTPAPRFQGLRQLAAKLGMSTSAKALNANEQPGDRDDDEDGDGTDPANPEKTPPVEAGEGEGEGATGEGEGEGESEGNDDEGSDGEGDGGDAGAGEVGEGGEAGDGAGSHSAEYNRGFAAGERTTAGRWAATFLNPACRANMELATDLLADTAMSPEKIGAYCERNGSAKKGIGATTPKPRVGLESHAGSTNTGEDADAGQQARANATQQVNRSVKARAGGRTRRAGGPGGARKSAGNAADEK